MRRVSPATAGCHAVRSPGRRMAALLLGDDAIEGPRAAARNCSSPVGSRNWPRALNWRFVLVDQAAEDGASANLYGTRAWAGAVWSWDRMCAIRSASRDTRIHIRRSDRVRLPSCWCLYRTVARILLEKQRDVGPLLRPTELALSLLVLGIGTVTGACTGFLQSRPRRPAAAS